MVCLPLLVLFLATGLLWSGHHHLRLALVQGAGITAAYACALTEGLGALHQFTPWTLALGWAIAAVGVATRLGQRRRLALAVVRHVQTKLQTLDTWGRLGVGAVLGLLGLRLAVGLVAPPNNFDSMTYHLPRVMHWLQHHTLAPYPTAELRQLYLPPGSALLTVQGVALGGGDRGVNLVQGLAAVVCVAGISWLSEQLAGARAGLLGAVGVLAIPMVVLQAATTQSDLLSAAWLVALACVVLPNRTYTLADGASMGLYLGLAALTKPTGLLFSLPLLGLVAYRLRRNPHPTPTTLGTVLITLSLIVTLAGPSYARNWHTFGHPLGPSSGTVNEQFGLTVLASNALKLAYMTWPLPPVRHLVVTLHQGLPLDLDAPTTTYRLGPTFSQVPGQLYLAPHEDFAGAFLLALLGVGALVWLGWELLSRRMSLGEPVVGLAIISLVNVGLFCGLLKWQPWGNRLVLGAWVLLVPVVASWLAQGERRWQCWWRRGVGTVLIGSALLYGLTSIRNPVLPLPIAARPSRSILTTPRLDLRFDNSATGRALKAPYLEVARLLAADSCPTVGLNLGPNDWEYPFWSLLPHRRFQAVGVHNASTHLPPQPTADLCAVISLTGASPTHWQTPVQWHQTYTAMVQLPDGGRKTLTLHQRQP